MLYIRIDAINKGYYDPATGKKLDSIEGRRNRPGVDAIAHLGWELPECAIGEKRIRPNVDLIMILDITNIEAAEIVARETKFNARKLTDEEVEEELKEKIYLRA